MEQCWNNIIGKFKAQLSLESSLPCMSCNINGLSWNINLNVFLLLSCHTWPSVGNWKFSLKITRSPSYTNTTITLLCVCPVKLSIKLPKLDNRVRVIVTLHLLFKWTSAFWDMSIAHTPLLSTEQKSDLNSANLLQLSSSSNENKYRWVKGRPVNCLWMWLHCF